MTDWASPTFEDDLIADMRAHDGAVTEGPLKGQELLVMTSTGAVSGAPRRAVLTVSHDGADYVVAGTAGGGPKDPGWLRNIQAHPEVRVETGNQTFDATATAIIDGPERDRLWEGHVAALPHFAGYPEQSGRLIPMVRITPAG